MIYKKVKLEFDEVKERLSRTLLPGTIEFE